MHCFFPCCTSERFVKATQVFMAGAVVEAIQVCLEQAVVELIVLGVAAHVFPQNRGDEVVFGARIGIDAAARLVIGAAADGEPICSGWVPLGSQGGCRWGPRVGPMWTHAPPRRTQGDPWGAMGPPWRTLKRVSKILAGRNRGLNKH